LLRHQAKRTTLALSQDLEDAREHDRCPFGPDVCTLFGGTGAHVGTRKVIGGQSARLSIRIVSFLWIVRLFGFRLLFCTVGPDTAFHEKVFCFLEKKRKQKNRKTKQKQSKKTKNKNKKKQKKQKNKKNKKTKKQKNKKTQKNQKKQKTKQQKKNKNLITLFSFFCRGCRLYEPNFNLSLDFNLSSDSRILLNAAPKRKKASIFVAPLAHAALGRDRGRLAVHTVRVKAVDA
jgi:hypothetical protein